MLQMVSGVPESRKPAVKWGPGSGIWKSTDGGKNFKKLSSGLPSADLLAANADGSNGQPLLVHQLNGETFAAPIFPLPAVRMSPVPLSLAMIKPKGIEPSR